MSNRNSRSVPLFGSVLGGTVNASFHLTISNRRGSSQLLVVSEGTLDQLVSDSANNGCNILFVAPNIHYLVLIRQEGTVKYSLQQ